TRQTKTVGQYRSTTNCMTTHFLVPPVGRRFTIPATQVKTKTKPSLEGKTQPKSVASQCLPLVGSEAWKSSERRPASRSTDDGSVQAHPSMRICSGGRSRAGVGWCGGGMAGCG